MQFLNTLKKRWNIESNWQVIIILIVFACTGFSAMFARPVVFNFLGIEETHPFWLKTVVWLLTIFPLYNVMLLMYATIFGQFNFFWAFIKKMFGRMIPSRVKS